MFVGMHIHTTQSYRQTCNPPPVGTVCELQIEVKSPCTSYRQFYILECQTPPRGMLHTDFELFMDTYTFSASARCVKDETAEREPKKKYTPMACSKDSPLIWQLFTCSDHSLLTSATRSARAHFSHTCSCACMRCVRHAYVHVRAHKCACLAYARMSLQTRCRHRYHTSHAFDHPFTALHP